MLSMTPHPGTSDHMRIVWARALCHELRTGFSWVGEVSALVHLAHLSEFEAGEMIGASVRVYCPDQDPKLPG